MKGIIKRKTLPKETTADKISKRQLSRLEQKIGTVYAEAERELEADLKDYLKKFAKRNNQMIEGLIAGRIPIPKGETPLTYYKKWLLNQVGRGKLINAKREQLAQRIVHYDEVATAYINDHTAGVYSLYRNYTAYAIDSVTGGKYLGADFKLYNEGAVRRLIVQEPKLMPHYPKERAIQKGYDLEYSNKMIRNEITKSIMNGHGIPKVAKAIEKGWLTKGADPLQELAGDVAQNVTRRTYKQAVRAARTANTCATNGAKLDSMEYMASIGIDVKKQWKSAHDARTRDSHITVDGEIRPLNEPFSNGLMYPADDSGRPEEVYNCRCTMGHVINGESTYKAYDSNDDASKYIEFVKKHGGDILKWDK